MPAARHEPAVSGSGCAARRRRAPAENVAPGRAREAARRIAALGAAPRAAPRNAVPVAARPAVSQTAALAAARPKVPRNAAWRVPMAADPARRNAALASMEPQTGSELAPEAAAPRNAGPVGWGLGTQADARPEMKRWARHRAAQSPDRARLDEQVPLGPLPNASAAQPPTSPQPWPRSVAVDGCPSPGEQPLTSAVRSAARHFEWTGTRSWRWPAPSSRPLGFGIRRGWRGWRPDHR